MAAKQIYMSQKKMPNFGRMIPIPNA